MNKYFFDFHIHSGLSPCADNDMTPNNIVNMSLLKGLDFIAITDHNTTDNIKAVIECAEDKDIIIVPGMEVETSEEIHLITLFKNLNDLKILSNQVYDSLPNINNRVDIFGEQLIYNKYDEIVGNEQKYLLTSCGLSIDDIIDITNKNDGITIPAHIFRNGYSIINTFGIIPNELGLSIVEISNNSNHQTLISQHSYLNEYKVITGSDAHKLEDILEPIQYVELEEKSIECLFDYFISLNKNEMSSFDKI